MGVEVLPMTRSLLALPLSLALALASLGCSGTVGPEGTTTATAETAATRAPIAQPVHGPLKAFADALGEVPLTATQHATIEKMASDSETRHAAARAAHKDLMLAVADQVQAGAIDRAALQPKLTAMVTALQASQPADRAAFEALHALLTPDQRTAFVNALEARHTEHAGAMQGKRPMQQWATDLQLTEDQTKQIHDAMKARWQAAGHDGNGGPHEGAGGPGAGHMHQGKQLLEAFAKDRFVMDEVSPPKDVATHAQHMSDHVLGMAEIALPILTPAQRTLAAQKLRDQANGADGEMPGME
jgi:Spy/CpxP family protein refolding chaperone